MASSRLIIVPQYPAKLRYSEWWPQRLSGYDAYFDEVVLLQPDIENMTSADPGKFAPAAAIDYELQQMSIYAGMELMDNDVLLLCDLSFPGMFASMLYHKRPGRCFAICHATSANRYDLFTPVRPSKWKVEIGLSKLFDKVFVASEYHQEKLGWQNLSVVKFPLPDVEQLAPKARMDGLFRHRKFVSVARPGVQKVNGRLEAAFVDRMGQHINRAFPGVIKSWDDYYGFLRSSDFLIVTSREETYGYQVIDALTAGVMPVAPAGMSYPEILPPDHLYEPGNVDSLVEVVKSLSENPNHPELWKDNFIDTTAVAMCSI